MRRMTSFTRFGSSISLDELLSSAAGTKLLLDLVAGRDDDDVELLVVEVRLGKTASKSAGLISCSVSSSSSSSLESDSLESVPSPLLVEPPRDA